MQDQSQSVLATLTKAYTTNLPVRKRAIFTLLTWGNNFSFTLQHTHSRRPPSCDRLHYHHAPPPLPTEQRFSLLKLDVLSTGATALTRPACTWPQYLSPI